ncbi:hypothetical protein, partial [Lacticaseibacillus paracasei]|uniref:hypothetical protein n=1 Tax=Lacticaseibacillus paracasei TaxID=1597 RepID=UPI00195A1B98
IFAHAITTDAWRNSLDHYQEFVIIVALDLKIEVKVLPIVNVYFKTATHKEGSPCNNRLPTACVHKI